MMPDRMQRGLTADSAARFLALEITEAADEARQRHQLNRGSARLLGEAMTAALMMSAYIKGEERITLQIQCEQPPLSISCDVTADGGVRARLSPPTAQIRRHGRLSGMLMVIKHDARAELYRGVTAIDDQTIASALSTHLRDSSQVDAIVNIHSESGPDGALSWAGGVLIERMPPATDLPHLTPPEFKAHYAPLRDLDGPALQEALAQQKLLGAPMLVMEERPLRWQCTCSRPRVLSMLVSLGADELQSMIEEDHGAEINCHFCGEQYTVNETELTELRATLVASGR
ncbi:MAG: molecular chaperone Hsp33 [Myxococcota bacterium]|jgi:molecular chaperone Hsp33